MTQIVENVFLGSLVDAKRRLSDSSMSFLCLLPEARDKEGVPQIFASDEVRPVLFKEVRDEARYASLMHDELPDCVEYINTQRKKQRPVLVFCRWGQSRSATVVVAYLMLSEGYKLFDAFWFVRGKRHNAFPNAGFFLMLQDMDVALYGKLSMTETRAEYLSINVSGQTKPESYATRKLKSFVKSAGRSKERKHRDPVSKSSNGIFEVAKHIFVGDEVSANDEKLVRTKKIQRMVSLAPAKQAQPQWAGEEIQYIGVPISSDPTDRGEWRNLWRRVHVFIRAGHGKKTLIFCTHGHSRSTSVVISYLILWETYTLHQAFWSVRQRNPNSFPSYDSFLELQALELETTGHATMIHDENEYMKLQLDGDKSEHVGGCLCGGMSKASVNADRPSVNSLRRAPAKHSPYGPIGLQLKGKLTLGDLCLGSGFAEPPVDRCLLLAGHPEYYKDMSDQIGMDLYRLEVLTPLPPDGLHQVRVAVRALLAVIDPDTFKIHLADEAAPANSEQWVELKVFCSPFQENDIDAELFESCIDQVSHVPCSAGESNSRTRAMSTELLIGEGTMEDLWMEMLASPNAAPIRAWQMYLWKHWSRKALSTVRPDEDGGLDLVEVVEVDAHMSKERQKQLQATFKKDLTTVMPLEEDSNFDTMHQLLRSSDTLWTRLELRSAETRYTKSHFLSSKTLTHGTVTDVDAFCGGRPTALVNKNWVVGNLSLVFVSHLGSGRHGAAFRAAVVPSDTQRDVWLDGLDVCVKVWKRASSTQDDEGRKEADMMRRLPYHTVPHGTQYIASSHISLPSHMLGGLKSLVKAMPYALISTLASGVPLSKALHGELAENDHRLWSVVNQIIEFSVGMEEVGAYHGDMTLDNALWDNEREKLTFIDFGNAGFTSEDPFKRVQRSGLFHMLNGLAEAIEHVLNGKESSCLVWLQSLSTKKRGQRYQKIFAKMMKSQRKRRQSGSTSPASPVASLPSTEKISTMNCQALHDFFKACCGRSFLTANHEGVSGSKDYFAENDETVESVMSFATECTENSTMSVDEIHSKFRLSNECR